MNAAERTRDRLEGLRRAMPRAAGRRGLSGDIQCMVPVSDLRILIAQADALAQRDPAAHGLIESEAGR